MKTTAWWIYNADTDIAIRVVLHPDDPDSIARPLAQWQTLICASPDYLREHPIAQPQDLLNADWLNHNSNVLLHAFKCLGLPETLPENRTDCPDSSLVAREYACAGMGIAALLSGDVASLIENGQLSVILPEHTLPTRTLCHHRTSHPISKSTHRIGLLNMLFW